MSASSETILRALGPRGAIVQAVSILMAEHDVSEESALDMLTRVASESNLKVREAASRIVAESRRG